MPDEEESTEPAQRRTMALIGACLALGFVRAAVAALDPLLSSVWTTRSTHAVSLIGDGCGGVWR
jgi:hypothetical protein